MPHLCGRRHTSRRGPAPTMADGGVPVAMTVLDDEAVSPTATAPARVAGEINAPTHQEIAELAYSYWEVRGGLGGSPWDDWFRAEQELLMRQER